MIDVVPFKLEHIEMLAAPRVDFGEVEAFDNPSVFAFTGMIGERVIGSAGAFLLWPGVGEAWALFSKMSLEEGRACFLTTRRRLHVFMQQGLLHRLQAAILVDDIQACRFARALDFKYEGEMPGYSADGATCVRYAKVI